MAGEPEVKPQRTIENIKAGLDELKRSSVQKTLSETTFKASIDNLTTSINELMKLFREATGEMKVEEEVQEELKSKIEPLLKKMDSLENENRTIAQSILALADMLKNIQENMQRPRIMPEAPRPAHLEPKPVMPPIPEPPRPVFEQPKPMQEQPRQFFEQRMPEPPRPFEQQIPPQNMPRQQFNPDFTQQQRMPQMPPMAPPPMPFQQQPRLTPVAPQRQIGGFEEQFGMGNLPPFPPPEEPKKKMFGRLF